jgi:protein CpxP
MKRTVIVGAVLAMVMTGSAWSAQEEVAGERGAGVNSGTFKEQCFKGKKAGHKRHFMRMAKELGLSDLQKAQIKTIFKSGREANAPLRQQLAESRKQLREATRAAAFDEAAVRALAEQQARLQTELAVAKARMLSEVHALLTPEQQVKAEKLFMERRAGHRPHFRG